MTKNRFKHFNPEEHKIESKIATVRTSHHCKYNINYHIIWIPKYRKQILKGKVIEVLKTIINGQCQEIGIQQLALEIMPDHLHLFVSAKPTITPFKIIQKLKGNTSIQLRRCFPFLKYLGYKQHFGTGFKALWARGYYCDSNTHYINSLKDYSTNRMDELENEIYVLNEKIDKLDQLEIWIKDIQRQRLLQWMIDVDYTNKTYPSHIGKDESVYVSVVEPTYVRINFGEEKYTLQMHSDNTFECLEYLNWKWKKIDCKDTKPEEVPSGGGGIGNA